VLGKSGRAMRFRGGPSRPPGFLVQHHWTGELPLFARALVLADGVLLAAGPDDLIDEESVFRQLNQAVGNTDLSDQAAALDGARGGVLWTVSAADGQQLSELRLDSPPVFDGMAAANGKLYLVAVDGSVVCFGGK